MIGRPNQVYRIGPLAFQFVEVFFTNANAAYPVAHKLDSAEVGWAEVDRDQPARIYSAGIPKTRSSLNLISDTAGVTATFMLIAPSVTRR